MTTTNTDDLTYEAWYKRVDRAVSALCGLGIDDLPDGNSYDAYDDGMTPREYAESVLDEEGFFDL